MIQNLMKGLVPLAAMMNRTRNKSTDMCYTFIHEHLH